MTKRKVLNIAAHKKRDNMGSWNPITSQAFTSIPFGTSAILYCPTARTSGIIPSDTIRTSSVVYHKGVRDRVQLDIDGGFQLRWRRVVFETKGLRDSTAYTFITGTGYRRTLTVQSAPATAQIAEVVFEGTAGTDYTDYFTAKIDTNRIKVHSDRIRIMRNGNDQTHTHSIPHYYPLEKTGFYDDEEEGDLKNGSPWHTFGLKGMGDIYVLDFFQNVGGNADDWSALIRANATHYWHEK